QRLARGVTLRLRQRLEVRRMGPCEAGDKFGIQRERGEPEGGRAEVWAGNLTKRSVAFLADFEARKMGTSCVTQTQNRCQVAPTGKSAFMALEFVPAF